MDDQDPATNNRPRRPSLESIGGLAGLAALALSLSSQAPPRLAAQAASGSADSAVESARLLLPFDGRLTTASGQPLSQGLADLAFALFRPDTDGEPVWWEERSASVGSGGMVRVLLGDKGPPLGDVDFSRGLELRVSLKGKTEVLATVRILPAPYAECARLARDSERLAGHRWDSIFSSPREARDPSVRDSAKFAGHDWGDVDGYIKRIEALEAEVASIKTRVSAHEKEIAAVRESANSAHNRIAGIKLEVSGNEQADFMCGEERKKDPKDLWVMYGSRDGTSCNVRNICYYKLLQILIPEKK